jgi:hypothetical protein
VVAKGRKKIRNNGEDTEESGTGVMAEEENLG